MIKGNISEGDELQWPQFKVYRKNKCIMYAVYLF